MKRINRFTTLRASRVLLLLCTMALALFGCHAAPSTPTSPAANAKGSPAYTLDVVLLGPFAVLDCPNTEKIQVLVPDVADHKPLGIGYPFEKAGKAPENYRELTPGEYELVGVPSANAMTVVNPVQDAEALTFPAKEVCSAIKRCENVCIDLPRPNQFVPWNADRAKVSRRGGDEPQSSRLATASVLRYPVSDFKGVKLSRKDAGKPCGSTPCELTPRPNETEGILALVLDPRSRDDDHRHARNAFRGIMDLLHVQAEITFPQEGDGAKKRNQPLVEGSVPPKLIESLDQMQQVRILGRENDCLSAQALVK